MYEYKKFYDKHVYNLTTDDKGQANGHCPFHEDKRKSFSANLRTGLWICHAGCGSGNALQFAERLGIPQEQLPGNNKTISGKSYPPNKNIVATYDYVDENNRLLYQVVRYLPKNFKVRRPKDGGGWIWNIKDVRRILYRLPEVIKNPNPVVIVEGEKDADRLRELGFNATTNQGGAGKWEVSYSEHLKDREIIIIPDNDVSGKDHAKKVASLLCSHVSKIKILDLPNLPIKGDVSDYLNNGGSIDELKKIIDNCHEYKPEVDALRQVINQIRKDGKIKGFEKKRLLADETKEYLKAKGSFIWTDETPYYFFDEEKRLYTFDDMRFAALINMLTGINRSEGEWNYLIEHLKTETIRHGQRAQIHKFAFYNIHNNCLYISRHDGQVYCLDGERIRLISNGSEGVLFWDDPNSAPFEYLGDNYEDGLISKYFVEPVNFTERAEVRLSPEEQGYIWFIYIHTIFFEALLPTKPIIAFIGDRGAGKTSVLNWFLQFLFGPKFQASSLAKKKEDAFLAAATRSYFIVFDNVDGEVSWLNDHLAAVATGAGIKLRKLYTTNEEVEYKPRVFISLTSRNPHFRREDVVDRLLLLMVDRRKDFKSEKALRQERLIIRNKLWAEMLNRLNKIVKVLKTDNRPFNTTFRMADWAELAWRIADSYGEGEKLLGILKRMETEQSTFMLEEEPLYETLSIWLEDESNINRAISAKELFNALSAIADRRKMEDWWIKNPRALAQRIKNLKSDLEVFLTIEVRDGGGGVKLYKFSPKAETTDTTGEDIVEKA